VRWSRKPVTPQGVRGFESLPLRQINLTKMIKHIWFDFSDTLTKIDKVKQNELRFSAYAEVTKKDVAEDLVKEYLELFEKSGRGNAAVFTNLGLPADFWSNKVNSIDPKGFYDLAEPIVLEILNKLNKKYPISIFTNIDPIHILSSLGIDNNIFKYIIKAGMVKEPKPSLEGFNLMIEMSSLPPSSILYIADV
jgi:FMN phosphatase YigB (HAD superfamily)